MKERNTFVSPSLLHIVTLDAEGNLLADEVLSSPDPDAPGRHAAKHAAQLIVWKGTTRTYADWQPVLGGLIKARMSDLPGFLYAAAPGEGQGEEPWLDHARKLQKERHLLERVN